MDRFGSFSKVKLTFMSKQETEEQNRLKKIKFEHAIQQHANVNNSAGGSVAKHQIDANSTVTLMPDSSHTEFDATEFLRFNSVKYKPSSHSTSSSSNGQNTPGRPIPPQQRASPAPLSMNLGNTSPKPLATSTTPLKTTTMTTPMPTLSPIKPTLNTNTKLILNTNGNGNTLNRSPLKPTLNINKPLSSLNGNVNGNTTSSHNVPSKDFTSVATSTSTTSSLSSSNSTNTINNAPGDDPINFMVLNPKTSTAATAVSTSDAAQPSDNNQTTDILDFDFDDFNTDASSSCSIKATPSISNISIPSFSHSSILKPRSTTSSTSSSTSSTSTSSSKTSTTTTSTTNNANDKFDQWKNSDADPTKTHISVDEIKARIAHEPFRKFAMLVKDSIIDVQTTKPYSADLQALPSDLNNHLKSAMARMKRQQLYSHQLECRQAVRSMQDVIITTPTSSGKSLSLFLPIFEEIINQKARGQKSCAAMFLFPLNALANNQQKAIESFNAEIDAQFRLKIKFVNGETDKASLPDIFSEPYPDILLTNPDWVHYQLQRGGFVEKWKGWRAWFAKLRFIVLDEAHTYSGIMGCHFINLLRRITNYHAIVSSTSPSTNTLQYMLASATIGNPIQMAKKLLSKPDTHSIHLIDRNGSGSFSKVYITLKPSTISQYHTPGNVIHHWVENNLKGIVFCNTIRGVNGLIQYLGSDSKYTRTARQVKAYYSSLKPFLKQETLNQLKCGQTKVIIATNALEAGVDISELDSCLIIGYPGSKMSWKQRIGRVGRSKMGLVVFIPSNTPLDKYYSQHLSSLLDGDTESLSFNGDFPTVLSAHLLCATHEIGIPVNYEQLGQKFGPQAKPIIDELVKTGKIKVQTVGNKTLWRSSDYVHNTLSIRGGTGLNEVVVAKVGKQVQIEEMSKMQAITRLFPGAIFMSHNTESMDIYQVLSLDMAKHGEPGTAQLERMRMAANTRITTTPTKSCQVDIVSVLQRKTVAMRGNLPPLEITFGVAKYTTIVRGYEKRTYSQVRSSTGRTLNDSHYNSTSESQKFSLKEPLQVHYETPFIQFAFQEQSRLDPKATLRQLFNKRIESFKKSSLCLNSRDFEPKIDDLIEMGEVMVMLHTIVHQILATVPSILLTSRNDVEECIPTVTPVLDGDFGRNNQTLDVTNFLDQADRIYLLDSAEGGTGSCQDIFDHIDEIFAKCAEFPPCPNCAASVEEGTILSEDFGCIFCLHSNHCQRGVLKSMGVCQLDNITNANVNVK
ncbi:hypothetical protein SAMD00019534_020030 [Acytostelium subglobosum LB1]|uniref:hypothetical protein n=1 Tax=Acytostelium subglobosum LB1 TaxID=1410327 RepID=UPI0006447ACC|nr:hypothetical protein SAMD00019534_020030 [Acytostelium subglobosum LB1]GAM18828.1 hypothetical protein SAMD00019534_020030 [Acytostelium subglobosum LB1]|eukprot:XP_012758048.1 hypothetical protein SAMD00019534_020030 [Acytostelium subglobosum LB1]